MESEASGLLKISKVISFECAMLNTNNSWNFQVSSRFALNSYLLEAALLL